MGSSYSRKRSGRAVVAAAVVFAGAGGSALGLGAPVWLAGTVAAISALVATVVVDRVFHKRDERAAACERLSEALDVLKLTAPGDEKDALGLLRADRSPVPFRGRGRELRRLADWRADDSANPVVVITGPAGVGKSRLALKFASGLPREWRRGWLRAGADPTVVSAARACGDPVMILVDDAEGRDDLRPLLNALAELGTSPAIRVMLVGRSAALVTSLSQRLNERHEWIVSRAPVLDLQPEGGPEDRERWFAEAATAFAASPPVRKVTVPAPSYQGRPNVTQPILVLHAQALLAVLGSGDDKGDPRKLSSGQVADALMRHEKRRWEAMAEGWKWGIGGPPSEDLRVRTVAALVLLGPEDDGEAEQILRRIPELRDAQEERLAAIAAWIAALYPPDPGGGSRMRPDMISEWFVVSQLTAHPAFAQNLRDGLTDRQAAQALSFLARAADRVESASVLFADFAFGDLRRLILAAAHAAMTGQVGRQLLDVVVAGQIRSADEWTIDQLTDLDRMIPDYVLPLTHIAVGDLSVRLLRGLTMSKDNPAVHRAALAGALDKLGIQLDRVGRYQEALAASEEAVALFRVLAEDNPAVHRQPAAGSRWSVPAGVRVHLRPPL